jgi:serine/threonine protein kinase
MLPVGTRLARTRFSLPLAGGMGEVYCARDTTLNRGVALKVLPDAFTRDADRLARFKREGQALTSDPPVERNLSRPRREAGSACRHQAPAFPAPRTPPPHFHRKAQVRVWLNHMSRRKP